MIRYTLRCACGNGFESWFPSSQSFEEQRARGLVSCPRCASSAVEKAVMAPSVARTDRAVPRVAPPEPATPAAETTQTPSTPVALMGPSEGELRALLRKVREHVEANADYVGKDFADLARKMHEGEQEHRAIYGEATREEVEALREDEVEVFPLPVLPEERN